MSHTRANILMLIASLIWGTAFVSQTTGMGAIGPFTFSFGRFFFAFLTVIPFAIYLEQQNIFKILSDRKKVYLCLATGFFLFGGMGLQQYALQKSLISNAAFLSTLYVPFVGIISRFIIKKQVHWIIWIAFYFVYMDHIFCPLINQLKFNNQIHYCLLQLCFLPYILFVSIFL